MKWFEWFESLLELKEEVEDFGLIEGLRETHLVNLVLLVDDNHVVNRPRNRFLACLTTQYKLAYFIWLGLSTPISR